MILLPLDAFHSSLASLGAHLALLYFLAKSKHCQRQSAKAGRSHTLGHLKVLSMLSRPTTEHLPDLTAYGSVVVIFDGVKWQPCHIGAKSTGCIWHDEIVHDGNMRGRSIKTKFMQHGMKNELLLVRTLHRRRRSAVVTHVIGRWQSGGLSEGVSIISGVVE